MDQLSRRRRPFLKKFEKYILHFFFFSLDVLTLARENIFKLEGVLEVALPKKHASRRQSSFTHIVFLLFYVFLFRNSMEKNRFYVDLIIVYSLLTAGKTLVVFSPGRSSVAT